MTISSLPWTFLLLAANIAMGATGASASPIPALPFPTSNNAVAAGRRPEGFALYSLFDLEVGRTSRDVSRRASGYDSASGRWHALPAPPAVGQCGGKVYLVSGWHDRANVADVQVFDTRRNRRQASTPWPGAPVFGHAGALHGDRLVVCDGVRLDVSAEGKRQFSASNQCWQGRLRSRKTSSIDWAALPAHAGKPRYRMAAGVSADGVLVFAGGSEKPLQLRRHRL